MLLSSMFLSGKIQTIDNFDRGDGLTLQDGASIFLSDKLESFHGKSVYCMYAFSDHPITMERMIDLQVQTAEGEVFARHSDHWSETSGYLWTDDDGKIGGHDLVKIFKDRESQYGAIIVQEEPIDLNEKLEILETGG